MSDYIVYIMETLSNFGDIKCRRLFGGYGIYKNDIIFSIVINNVVYFKVDASNQVDYEKYCSRPFSYESKGRLINLSYWQVPTEILEDETELINWARNAYDIQITKRKCLEQKSRKI